ncbi:MAG: ribbon-helix-helix domain-containing protein [Desulfobacterales bacterium]
MVYTSWEGRMIRTQIYLTDRQRAELAALSKTLGKKQSELIREAVDCLIDQAGQGRRKIILHAAAGIWKDRTDLPDVVAMRNKWDRY